MSQTLVERILQLLLERILLGCVKLLQRCSTQELHRRIEDLRLRDRTDLAVHNIIRLAGVELQNDARLEELAGASAADIDENAFLRVAKLVEHPGIVIRFAPAAILRMRR